MNAEAIDGMDEVAVILKLRWLRGTLSDLEAARDAEAEAATAANRKALVTCDKCDGSGEVECECDNCDNVHESTCGECDGRGKRSERDEDSEVDCAMKELIVRIGALERRLLELRRAA